MRKYAKIIAGLLLCAGMYCLAQAQIPTTGAGMGAPLGVATYTGPGDVQSGATAWWGLRAYNAATAGTKSISACNLAGTCADFSTNSSGNLVIGTPGGSACSVAVSSGTYVSATGATVLTTSLSSLLASTNTFFLTGLTATGLNAANVTGLLYGQTATTGSTGTTINFTGATGLGTFTITGGTVSVCTVAKVYDKIGTNDQGPNVTAPTLVINCVGSLPCLGVSSQFEQDLTSGTITLPQAISISIVESRDVVQTGSDQVISDNAGNFGINGQTSTSNGQYIYSGSIFGETVSDGVLHGINVTFNGASSIFNIDNTNNTGNAGTNTLSTSVGLGGLGGGGFGRFWTGRIAEGGIWPNAAAFNGTQAGALGHNQCTYWGFKSC